MSGRTVIFVIGMMRSGTSALTRVLSLCGCDLPNEILGATGRNPRGEWESVASLRINDDFLLQNGTSNWDPTFRFQEKQVLEQGGGAELLQRARQFFVGCGPGKSIVLIKDLRITTLLSAWADAACAESFSVKVVVALRKPQEVVASLGALGAHPMLSYALWLKYNLLAERTSRRYPRVFIEHSNLITDWRRQVNRASGVLNIQLHLENERAVDYFLTKDLYRQRSAGPIEDVFGVPWISQVYSLISQIAQDKEVPIKLLDEIYDERVACERAHRLAMAEYNKYPPESYMFNALHEPTWEAGRDF